MKNVLNTTYILNIFTRVKMKGYFEWIKNKISLIMECVYNVNISIDLLVIIVTAYLFLALHIMKHNNIIKRWA